MRLYYLYIKMNVGSFPRGYSINRMDTLGTCPVPFPAGLPWIWISMEISMDGYRVFVISMDIVEIHFKIEL